MNAILKGLNWDIHGHDWPNRDFSQFIEAGGVHWHVQIMGQGPVILLLHGTGAASHSWRDLAPLLAERFTVIAPDLPGQGFSRPTQAGSRVHSLPGMAQATKALLNALGQSPAMLVGHSAGAAIAARLCLDKSVQPQLLVSLNGVMLPLPGPMSGLFSASARVLSMLPMVPEVFAWRATDRKTVDQLLAGTGSQLDERGRALYGRLVRQPGHVAGTLRMMHHWNLDPLAKDLPKLSVPLVQLVASQDRMVPPDEAARVAQILPQARRLDLPGLGHLAHEEHPQLLAGIFCDEAQSHGIFPAKPEPDRVR